MHDWIIRVIVEHVRRKIISPKQVDTFFCGDETCEPPPGRKLTDPPMACSYHTDDHPEKGLYPISNEIMVGQQTYGGGSIHPPDKAGPNHCFQPLDLYWSSPGSGVPRYKSRCLHTTFCSHSTLEATQGQNLSRPPRDSAYERQHLNES